MKPNQTNSNRLGTLTTFAAAIISLAVLGFGNTAKAGNTWTGGGGDNNWSDAANWGGATPAYGTATFSGTTRTNPVLNVNYSMNQVNFASGGPWSFYGTSSFVLSLFDNGGGQAKVENNGTSGVIISAPITFAANNASPPNPFGEINAVNSDLTFVTNTLTVNGSSVNGIKFFGSSHVINFNTTVSASGKWFGHTTGGTGNTINIGGSFTSGDFYVQNGGTVNLNSGGTFTTSAVRLGGDFGNTGNQDQTKSGTFNLAAAAGGLTYSSVINSVTGNTSGTLAVNSQNTSGTNTLSGHIALDVALKITQSAGGTLNITQAKDATTTTGTDIKGQTLTVTANGNINHSGTIYNSTGSGSITMNGSGTLTLSGTNTYSGTTTISTGNITVAPTGNLGSGSVVAIASAGSLTVSNSCSVAELHEFASGNGGTATIASGVVLTVNGSSLGTFYMNSISGGGGLTMAGSGSQMQLYGSQTYSGNTTINAGTLGLQNGYTLPSGSSVVIAAGGTLDVSAVTSPYNWGSSAGLTASGTGTTVGSSAAAIKGPSGGTVSLGSQPITLTYDGSHPALYITNSTLSLNGNPFTVNSSSALAAGTYTIAQQASGSFSSSGSYTVTGTAIGSGQTGSIQVSGGNVNLVIKNNQTISFTSGTSLTKTYGNATFADSATATSGLTVTYSSDNTGVATVDASGNVTIVAQGTAHILANQAGNGTYNAAPQVSQTLTVNKATLTPVVTLNNYGYNGTTGPTTIATRSTTGTIYGSDAPTLTGGTVAAFSSANVGGYTPSVTGLSLTGTGSGNYQLSSSSTTASANITAATLTPVVTLNNYVYDGTTGPATIATRSTTGTIYGSDAPTLTGGTVEAFSSKNVGSYSGISVTSLSLTGTGSGNYQLSSSSTTASASITALPITVTAATNTKNYDATTSAAAVPTVTAGSVQTGDTASFTETYDTKNVGTGKTLTPAGSVTDGNGGNNYSVTFANNTTGVINATNITVTAATNTKNYDGNTTAAATPTITSGSLQGTDTASFTETYDTKNAGTGKTLTPAGVVTDGDSGNNYNYTYATVATGVINPASASVSVVSSENPSGYHDSLTFTATLPSDATSTVNFLTNGVLFDTETLSSGSATSLSITNLPRGTNEITVQYAGDGNYAGSTNDLAGGQVVTNHPPVAGDATYYRAKSISLKITISDLLTNVTDVDGDIITLTGVGSGTNGATILTNDTCIYYLPSTGASSNYNDSFTYTVSDGFGGSATGNISVNVYSAAGPAQMSIPTNGVVNIKFFGIPTYTYVVATTTNLNSSWWPLSTNTAGSDGSWQFTDPNATNSQQYYRTQQP